MRRLSRLVDGAEVQYRPEALYECEITTDGGRHIVTDISVNQVSMLLDLIEIASEPFQVLYVLHTPRGEGAPGRYHSPSMTVSELRRFLESFQDYLEGDGRFDLWIRAESGTHDHLGSA